MSDLNSINYNKLKSLIEVNSRINLNYADPDSLLVSNLESAMQLVKCEAATLLFYNPETKSYNFEACTGDKKDKLMGFSVGKNSVAGWVYENKGFVVINDITSDDRFNPEFQNLGGLNVRNILAFPINFKGVCLGVFELINKSDADGFGPEDFSIVQIIASQASVSYHTLLENKKKQNQLDYLQEKFGKDYHTFIAKNPAIISLLKNIREAGETKSSVLITGESGVGKELFAEQVHIQSNRKDKPFVRFSCASLSPTLLESELFGHVKGAFTDAQTGRKGRFELADGGSIFLDEIGELPLNLQAKLLRVIQEKKFERVGSSQTISVDVRIIAATNRDLEQMVKEGTFRSDLYFRLNVLPLNVPPLRERKDELADFADFFLAKFRKETNKNFIDFSDAAKKAMLAYMWPGNIRELENTIERACIIGRPPFVQVKDLRLPVDGSIDYDLVQDAVSSSDKTLKTALNNFKREYITKILEENNWNQTAAAKVLDIQRTYVSKLMLELGIKK
ncbi:MAG: sigma-54-dependent Fis family transcriptional regulator [Treponema sp.]|nr:sigma-54-dependent Fis family transcriptional regulator [Treponema sp.]